MNNFELGMKVSLHGYTGTVCYVRGYFGKLGDDTVIKTVQVKEEDIFKNNKGETYCRYNVRTKNGELLKDEDGKIIERFTSYNPRLGLKIENNKNNKVFYSMIAKNATSLEDALVSAVFEK